MNLQPGDIVIRRTADRGNTLWLSQRLLCQELGDIETYLAVKARQVYKQSVQPCHRNDSILPDTGKAWRWARINGRFYYDYARIPDRKPVFYRSALPGEQTLTELADSAVSEQQRYTADSIRRELVQRVANDIDGSDIRYYMYDAQPRFTAEKAGQLAAALAWCRIITGLLDGNRFRTLGVTDKETFYQLCAETIAPLGLEGMKINTAKSLRKKITQFAGVEPLHQRDFLISGRYGNDYARIVGKYEIVHPETGEIMQFDVHQAIMFEAWMNPFKANKRTKRDLYENEYVPRLEAFGIEPVDIRTFDHYLNSFANRVLMSKERDGSKHFNDNYMPYIPAHQVQFANSMWVGDGSGTKLAYSYKNKEGELKKATLYMVRISDVASRMIVGYAIGTHETPALVKQALQMAVQRSGNIEALEFLSDNGSAFTVTETKQMLNVLFRKVRNITVGNSQENPAEMLVKFFTESARVFDNWLYTGFNAHHINNVANPDYFPKPSELGSMSEAYQQVTALVEKWNNTPWGDGQTPLQRFESKNSKCGQLDGRALRFAFGNRTSVDLAYQRGFVVVRKQVGESIQNYKYEIPDYDTNIREISRSLGYKSDAEVTVCWDANAADLYTPEGAFIISCPPARLSAKTEFEATNETEHALGHNRARKNDMVEAANAFRDEVVRSADVFKYGHVLHGGKVKDLYNETTEEALFEALEETVVPAVVRRAKRAMPLVLKTVEEDAFDQL